MTDALEARVLVECYKMHGRDGVVREAHLETMGRVLTNAGFADRIQQS